MFFGKSSSASRSSKLKARQRSRQASACGILETLEDRLLRSVVVHEGFDAYGGTATMALLQGNSYPLSTAMGYGNWCAVASSGNTVEVGYGSTVDYSPGYSEALQSGYYQVQFNVITANNNDASGTYNILFVSTDSSNNVVDSEPYSGNLSDWAYYGYGQAVNADDYDGGSGNLKNDAEFSMVLGVGNGFLNGLGGNYFYVPDGGSVYMYFSVNNMSGGSNQEFAIDNVLLFPLNLNSDNFVHRNDPNGHVITEGTGSFLQNWTFNLTQGVDAAPGVVFIQQITNFWQDSYGYTHQNNYAEVVGSDTDHSSYVSLTDGSTYSAIIPQGATDTGIYGDNGVDYWTNYSSVNDPLPWLAKEGKVFAFVLTPELERSITTLNAVNAWDFNQSNGANAGQWSSTSDFYDFYKHFAANLIFQEDHHPCLFYNNLYGGPETYFSWYDTAGPLMDGL